MRCRVLKNQVITEFLAPSTSFTSALHNNSMAEFTLMYQQQLAMAQMLAANPYMAVGFYPGVTNPFMGVFSPVTTTAATTTWPGLDYASLLGMPSPATATAPAGLLTPPSSVAIGADFMETLAKLPTSLPPKIEPNNNINNTSNGTGPGPSSSQKSPAFTSSNSSVKNESSGSESMTKSWKKASIGASVAFSSSSKRSATNSHSTSTAESTSKPRASSVIVENCQHSSESKNSTDNSYHLHNGGLEALADAALKAAAEEDKIASFIDSVVNSVVSSPVDNSKDVLARNSKGPKLSNAVLLDPKSRQPKMVVNLERKPASSGDESKTAARRSPQQNHQQTMKWDLNLLNASLAEAFKSNPQLDPNLLAVLESNPYLFSGIQASLLNAQKAVTSIVSAPIKCEKSEEMLAPPKKQSSLDVTIDSVINGAIQAAYAVEGNSPSPVLPKTPKTVKEQLAKKRASESPLDLSLKLPPPYSAGLLLANGLKEESGSRTPSTLSEASAVETGQKRRISSSECGEQNNRDTPTPTKRKRRKADESLCRIPLQHGWRRETLIRDITASGIKGDVSYVAPCGKKLATYSDLMRVNINISNNYPNNHTLVF